MLIFGLLNRVDLWSISITCCHYFATIVSAERGTIPLESYSAFWVFLAWRGCCIPSPLLALRQVLSPSSLLRTIVLYHWKDTLVCGFFTALDAANAWELVSIVKKWSGANNLKWKCKGRCFHMESLRCFPYISGKLVDLDPPKAAQPGRLVLFWLSWW